MEVKGAALASIPDFVRNKFGKEGFYKWLHTLSAEARDVYRYPIKLNEWYPLKSIMSEPTRRICELFYDNSIRGAWEAGRFSAEFTLHSIYKIFVRLGSVESLIKRASVILPTYYKPSAIKVTESSENQGILHIDQFPELDEIIENRIAGWIECAVEISGQKDVQVKTGKSLLKGDPYTEFLISWKQA
jgi:hypothetical protein